MNINSNLTAQAHQLAPSADWQPPTGKGDAGLATAQKVYDAFSSFVGETFYAQMMKSMRSTVGKPAYFHGGQAEEVFRGQLDQQLATEWAEQSGSRFADAMFEQQFPNHARQLQAGNGQAAPGLDDLAALRRR